MSEGIYLGIAAGSSMVGIISGLVWLIITLVTKPLKDDVAAIKRDLHTLLPLVKTEAELNRMIDVKVAQHAENCALKVDGRIHAAVGNHERAKHGGEK